MSWFGIGGSSLPKKPEVVKEDPAFVPDTNINASEIGIGGPTHASKFEQELLVEQERVLVQSVIFKLTELSFEKCVSKPSSQLLSASERNCIAAVTTKYLETSQFVINNLGPALMNQQQRKS